MTQLYEIAGLTVAMDSFGRTRTQAEPYLIHKKESADIVIRSDWHALQKKQPHLSEEDSEYLMTGYSFYHQLLKFQGMLLHSSAVVRDGHAYLFTAPCGTGKSTHTQLWMQQFQERAMMVNDDKPLLELTYPRIAKFHQPLSGIIAGKRNLFERMTFEKDYGVDIGILIDAYKLGAKIKEVDIGKIENDSQDWRNLVDMSKQVTRAILKRKFKANIKKLKNLENSDLEKMLSN